MFTINTAPQDVYIEDLIDKKAPLSYHQCHKRCLVAHLNLINQLSWKAFFGDQNQSQNYRCNQFYHLSTVMVCTVGDTRNCLCWLIQLHGQLISCHDQFSKGSRKKTGYFTVRLTVRGGGVTAPSLTVSKCENVDLFFPWNMIL